MGIISEMLSYPFMVRALIGGLLVSLCASLLGVSLVLKRYSMIGDGLSHVSFGSLSIALAAGWSPLKVSIPVVVLAAFFLLRITEHGKVKSDADNRYDDRCQQLYVWKHSRNEPGRCPVCGGAFHGGAWIISFLL